MTYAFDPELKDIIAFLPDFDLADPVLARASLESLAASLNKTLRLDALDIRDIVIPANSPVKVRLYEPRNKIPNNAALLYLHGGGFVMGSIDTEHGSAATLAEQLNITVCSVDYRLAPEHPYPAALNDCMTALQWLHDAAGSLAIDARRIGVMGVSAGGGLAATLALRCRDEGKHLLCFQLLDMPELDDRLNTPSMQRFVDTPLWSLPKAKQSWQHYLGPLHGQADIPAHAAAARAQDLSRLPPAYISVMEFDPLRDEGIIYALRLLQAGVTVELHHFPGTFHGSSVVPHAAISKRQHSGKVLALKTGLSIPSSPLLTTSAR